MEENKVENYMDPLMDQIIDFRKNTGMHSILVLVPPDYMFGLITEVRNKGYSIFPEWVGNNRTEIVLYEGTRVIESTFVKVPTVYGTISDREIDLRKQ